MDLVSRGRRTRKLVPLKRRILDRSATAAVFIHYGFDKFGHIPYEVFIQSMIESPSRLLGHELLLNKSLGGKNGVENLVDVAYLIGDAKVDYPKSTMGVFPPSGFDERLAKRSMKLPRAHMYLEHVYGYAGESGCLHGCTLVSLQHCVGKSSVPAAYLGSRMQGSTTWPIICSTLTTPRTASAKLFSTLAWLVSLHAGWMMKRGWACNSGSSLATTMTSNASPCIQTGAL